MKCKQDGGKCGLGGYCNDCQYVGYYSVTANKKSWSKDRISVEDFTSKGYKVSPSRAFGKHSVFSSDGLHLVAILFQTKAEAMAFIES